MVFNLAQIGFGQVSLGFFRATSALQRDDLQKEVPRHV